MPPIYSFIFSMIIFLLGILGILLNRGYIRNFFKIVSLMSIKEVFSLLKHKERAASLINERIKTETFLVFILFGMILTIYLCIYNFYKLRCPPKDNIFLLLSIAQALALGFLWISEEGNLTCSRIFRQLLLFSFVLTLICTFFLKGTSLGTDSPLGGNLYLLCCLLFCYFFIIIVYPIDWATPLLFLFCFFGFERSLSLIAASLALHFLGFFLLESLSRRELNILRVAPFFFVTIVTFLLCYLHFGVNVFWNNFLLFVSVLGGAGIAFIVLKKDLTNAMVDLCLLLYLVFGIVISYFITNNDTFLICFSMWGINVSYQLLGFIALNIFVYSLLLLFVAFGYNKQGLATLLFPPLISTIPLVFSLPDWLESQLQGFGVVLLLAGMTVFFVRQKEEKTKNRIHKNTRFLLLLALLAFLSLNIIILSNPLF